MQIYVLCSIPILAFNFTECSKQMKPHLCRTYLFVYSNLEVTVFAIEQNLIKVIRSCTLKQSDQNNMTFYKRCLGSVGIL